MTAAPISRRQARAVMVDRLRIEEQMLQLRKELEAKGILVGKGWGA